MTEKSIIEYLGQRMLKEVLRALEDVDEIVLCPREVLQLTMACAKI
jgi:GTP:adenosylcobinamide-phosphate guanylyltransferase